MENSPHNPYATSAAVVQDHVVDKPESLAGRGQRFLASLVDGIIMLAIVFPIWIFGFGMSAMDPDPTLASNLGMAALGFVVFWLVNGSLLHKNGQTVGKKILGIRIVRSDGSKAELMHLAVRRVLPVQVVSAIPFVSLLAIVDVLFIFGEKQQCVHDLIADTKVVCV